MVKNYLVGSVRPVDKIWYPNVLPGEELPDNPNKQINYELYLKLYKISRASARKFLQGEWEEVLHQAPILDARMFQIAQWYLVKELWFREPCNILCMGSDTVFIKPTEIFGRYKEMRMFNHSDPKTHPDFAHYHNGVGHNFNDDVRYFPSTMDPKIWDIGERHMNDWFTHTESQWACGQHINNHMLWSQGIPVEEMLEPRMAWQVMGSNFNESAIWNNCSFTDVNIIHLHGSRGVDNRLEVMKQIADFAGVDYAV